MVAALFLLFGALSAFVEAVLYARRGAESFSFNEHVVMTLQRAAVLLLGLATLLLYRWTGSAWYVVSEAAPALLLFPLVHDEAYNLTRLWLTWTAFYQKSDLLNIAACKPPIGNTDRLALVDAWREYRYGYQSPTTTARNDFNGRQRTWLALLGLVAWTTAAYLLL